MYLICMMVTMLTYIKLDSPSASAFERRRHSVKILAPESEELLDSQRTRSVVSYVADSVFLADSDQPIIYVERKLKTITLLYSPLPAAPSA